MWGVVLSTAALGCFLERAGVLGKIRVPQTQPTRRCCLEFAPSLEGGLLFTRLPIFGV